MQGEEELENEGGNQNLADFDFGASAPEGGEKTPSPESSEGSQPSQEPQKPGSGTPQEPPAGTEKPSQEPPSPSTEGQAANYDWLKEATAGQVVDPQGLKSLMEEHNRMKQQIEAGPQFSRPEQKSLYEFASKFEGNESAAALNYLHLQNLKLEEMPAQDLLFEKFKMENPGLDPSFAKEVFDETFDEKYGLDEEDRTAGQKWKLDQDKAEASKYLTGLKTEFESAASQTPEAVSNENEIKVIDAGLSNFKMNPFSFDFGKDEVSITDPSANADEVFSLNPSPEEVAKIGELAKNGFDHFAERYKGENGVQQYLEDLYLLENQKQIYSKIAGHAYQQGKLAATKDIKNIAPAETPGGGADGSSGEDSLVDAIKIGQGLR